jgi:hypothetical protein
VGLDRNLVSHDVGCHDGVTTFVEHLTTDLEAPGVAIERFGDRQIRRARGPLTSGVPRIGHGSTLSGHH